MLAGSLVEVIITAFGAVGAVVVSFVSRFLAWQTSRKVEVDSAGPELSRMVIQVEQASESLRIIANQLTPDAEELGKPVRPDVRDPNAPS